MKAIEINGEIKVYKSLPASWKGVMGNFSMLSDEEIKTYGFYDVVTPDYNSKSQELSDIFWDASNEIFTYNVNEKEWSQTLNELKQLRITSLKVNIQNKLNETDWYVTRKSEKSTAIPNNITTHRDAVRTKQAEMETAITNAADTAALETLYKFVNTGTEESPVYERPLGELPELES